MHPNRGVNMITINLEDLEGIPKKYIDRLKCFDTILKQNKSLDSIIEIEEIEILANEIHDFCNRNLIFGFHYTRALPEEILKTGLTCRSGEEIRNVFLKNHSKRFTVDELEFLKNKWEGYFDRQAQKSRDNRLYFNFTTNAIDEYGAQPLLRSYGGEQIYMPIPDDSKVGEKLMQIGLPLILKCKLKPTNLNTFYDNSWGRIAVSSYHNKLNPSAYQYDQDGHQSVNVPPSDIEIIEYKGNLHFC